MTETPDGVPCRHCGEPIFWDEICWVHANGWATCGTTWEVASISAVASLLILRSSRAKSSRTSALSR